MDVFVVVVGLGSIIGYVAHLRYLAYLAGLEQRKESQVDNLSHHYRVWRRYQGRTVTVWMPEAQAPGSSEVPVIEDVTGVLVDVCADGVFLQTQDARIKLFMFSTIEYIDFGMVALPPASRQAGEGVSAGQRKEPDDE